ncbi:hypothetical protein BESB_039320 [Besnoitia besnoiti]|uniref:C-type lectin domain-containing protein n=1 Tax=Besnoitia besnoiti TaxID=94643 RepID=A0A2A9MJW5_BESBE|nr:hypothetical protein BESB_039320 [Besnoitia besnoiti]PFH37474.1 hypothetical protein BESB_039320 [Besnoitia besnoiti]
MTTGRELQTTAKRLRSGTSFQFGVQEGMRTSTGDAEQDLVPIVDDKYANAARLVNEYVSRDKSFEEAHRACPRSNWMRVQGTSGRCFKSFDFLEFGIGPVGDGDNTVKQVGTWEEAERICMGFGAHLAALYTAAEMKFAHMVLDRRPDACWIGLRRLEPHRARRNSDTSNGWKWITSDNGIQDDTYPIEWHRDWAPVWDSISYAKPLCGVFTKKGIAARRCYANTGPTGGLADNRVKKGQKSSAEKLPAPELSCFLCATYTSTKLPEQSFAYSAENGLFVWTEAVGGTPPFDARQSGATPHSITTEILDERVKDERRYSKEGKKSTWGLSKLHERNTMKGMKRHSESALTTSSRKANVDDVDQSSTLEDSVDEWFPPRSKGVESTGTSQNLSERSKEIPGDAHELTSTAYSTTASDTFVYNATHQPAIDSEAAFKVTRIPSMSNHTEKNEMGLRVDAHSQPSNDEGRDTAADNPTAPSLATSALRIKDSESYGAFLQEFMRLHSEAKEVQGGRKENAMHGESTAQDSKTLPAVSEPHGTPAGLSVVSLKTEQDSDDRHVLDGSVGKVKEGDYVQVSPIARATPVADMQGESEVNLSSAESPQELPSRDGSAVGLETESAATQPLRPPSVGTPPHEGKEGMAGAEKETKVKLLHIISCSLGIAIFILGAILLLICLRCSRSRHKETGEGDSQESESTQAKTMSLPLSIESSIHSIGSSVSGSPASRGESSYAQSRDEPVPAMGGSCCQQLLRSDGCSPQSRRTVFESRTLPGSRASLGRIASPGGESVFPEETWESSVSTSTSNISQSAGFQQLGSETLVSAIVRGIRVAAGMSEASSTRDDAFSTVPSVLSSDDAGSSLDGSAQTRRPSTAERLERLRARIDAL